MFTNDQPHGFVVGIQTIYTDGETDTIAKSMTDLQNGDTLEFLCDYYLKKMKIYFISYKATGKETIQWSFCLYCKNLAVYRTICEFIFNHAIALPHAALSLAL